MALVRLTSICLFLGLVGAQSPTMAPTSGGCLSGWAEFGNNCYFISPGLMYKSACDTYCPGLKSDATLLCVMNSAENNFLAAMITSSGAPYAFTGLTDVAQEGTFAWQAGCSSTYNVPWQSGEPNGGYSENYAFMQPDGKFVDTGNNQLNCMCQYSLPALPTVAPSRSPSAAPVVSPTVLPTLVPVVTPTVAPTLAPVAAPTLAPTVQPTTICAAGWSNHGEKCYKKAGSVMTHNPCASYCPAQRADATMLCFQNADENAYIASQYTNVVWLGYNDVAQEGNFVWGPGCDSTYSNWTPGTPNNGNDGNYVLMSANGQFDDTSDGAAVCYCEYSLPRVPSVRPSASPSAVPTLSAADQIRTSPTYTAGRNAFSFAVKAANGDVFAWGEAPHGGNASFVVPSSQLQGVTQVVPGRFSFAARKGGTIAAWGLTEANLAGAGIVNVVANEAAFAGIDNNGKVYAWGSKHSGGDIIDPARCPDCAMQLAAGVTQIVASSAAFAAIKDDGSVFVWGSPYCGGDASAQVLASAAGAVKIVAARSAFAALLPNGGVVTWGDSFTGGDSSTVQHLLVNVVHIVAAPSVFVAFRSDLSIVTWGYGRYGGDSSQALQPLTNVVFVAHTLTAMAALKADGTVVTWGVAGDGGDSSGVTLTGIQTIHANSKAFVAVKSAGGLVAWGKAAFGGSGLPSGLVSGAVTSVHHTDRAFLAVKQNGEVVVWGQAGHGGSPDAAVRAEVGAATGLVHTVCSNEVAFSVLTTAGKVVAWGHPVSVPVPGVLFTDVALTSTATCA